MEDGGTIQASYTRLVKTNEQLLLYPFTEDCIRWTPHRVIVTIRDNNDYVRVLAYPYYSTIAGWGVLQSETSMGETLKEPSPCCKSVSSHGFAYGLHFLLVVLQHDY